MNSQRWADEEQDGSEKTAIGLGFLMGDNHGLRSKTRGGGRAQSRSLLRSSANNHISQHLPRRRPCAPTFLFPSNITRLPIAGWGQKSSSNSRAEFPSGDANLIKKEED